MSKTSVNTTGLCPICGKNLALVGKAHPCQPMGAHVPENLADPPVVYTPALKKAVAKAAKANADRMDGKPAKPRKGLRLSNIDRMRSNPTGAQKRKPYVPKSRKLRPAATDIEQAIDDAVETASALLQRGVMPTKVVAEQLKHAITPLPSHPDCAECARRREQTRLRVQKVRAKK